jgi:hypothetical protein
MKRIAGGLLLLMGAGLAYWIVYTRLTGQGGSQSPLAGVGFCIALFVVGFRWIRGNAPIPTSHPPGEDRPKAVVPSRSVGIDINKPKVVAPIRSVNIDINVSNFTGTGWLLLTCTFLMVLGGTFLLVFSVPGCREWIKDGRSTLMAFGVLAAAIGFYQLGKFILSSLGIPIYRTE